MSRHIEGKRWYSRLVSQKGCRALMDDFPLSTLERSIVACLCHSKFGSYQDGPVRLFARFNSYMDFFKYFMAFDPLDRGFYEIAFGEFAQKPHFDIDIQDVSAYDESPLVIGQKVIDAVIRGCIDVLASRGITLDIARDVGVYDSNGPRKCSYHLVLLRYCHSDHREARGFYQEVVACAWKYTQGKYLEYVDPGVYSKVQQFRVVGCQKEGSGRPKWFNDTFIFEGQKYAHIFPESFESKEEKNLITIYESLISFTSGCRMLPSFAPPPPPPLSTDQLIQDVQVGEILELFREKMDVTPFTIRGIQDNYIILKRERPSFCPVCNVVHDHENPLIVLVNNQAYWKCRRALKGYPLGVVTPVASESGSEVDRVVDEDCVIDGMDYSMGWRMDEPSGKMEEIKSEKVVEEKVVEEKVETVTYVPPEQALSVVKQQSPIVVKQESPVLPAIRPCVPPMAVKKSAKFVHSNDPRDRVRLIRKPKIENVHTWASGR